jgi:hypothetical protein
LFWLVFALVAVAIRGIAWDEAYERAQVLTGDVVYPAWHPLVQYAHRAFGLHYVSAAALLNLTGSAFVVCGLRNVLAVWMTTLPAFLIGASLARRALWGYVAAALLFLGAHLEFASYYPLFVWPDMFTSGHIGMGYALCTLWAWMTAHHRLGALLLCAMPLVHLGQMPPVLCAVMLALGWSVMRGHPVPWRRMLPWSAVGMGLVVCYAALHTCMLPAMPADSPLTTAGDYAGAWARYTAHNDVHRAYPRYGQVGNSIIALVGLLVLTGPGRVREARRGRNAPHREEVWTFLYGSLCLAGFAMGVGAIRLLGESVPFLLVSWMPQRLSNHAAVLLAAVACGVIGRYRKAAGVVVLALLLQAVKPLLALLLPEGFFTAYVAPPEMLLFFLMGAAVVLALLENLRPLVAVALTIAMVVTLGLYHQTGAAYGLLGTGLAYVMLTRGPNIARPGLLDTVLGGLTGVCVAIALWCAWQQRASLPASDWDRTVREALAEEPNAMLAAPHWEINVQERTGHPVLVTYETHQFIPYVPALAPGIEQMYHDVYGLRFGEPWRYDLTAWESRSAAEWRALATRYGFEYVMSPQEVPLPLEETARNGHKLLYKAYASE